MFDNSEFNLFLSKLMDSIKDRLKYYRTYSAEVAEVSDPDMEGKIGLKCIELLAVDSKSYIWAKPVGDSRAYQPAKTGDQVVLFFKDADQNEARFLAEIPDGMVSGTTIQDVATIFEAATNGSSIKCDDKTGGFTVESKSEGGKSFPVESTVLGQKLKELIDYILDSYITDIYARIEKIDKDLIAHKHIAPMGPTSSMSPPEAVNRQMDIAEIGSKKSDIPKKKSAYAEPGKLLSKVNKNN